MRIIAAVLLLAFLGACADPASVGRIRPGISSDVDLDAIRPPSGVTYNFSVEQGGLPLPAALSLTSRKRGTKRYDYNGSIAFQVPGDAAQIQDVAKLITQAFRAKGPRIRGNKVFLPINIRADNRFRATSSSLLAANDTYAPHDCFAVIGTCRYTASRGKDAKLDYISETTEAEGIWRTITRVDPNTAPRAFHGIREIMTYSIDENAMVIDLAFSERGANAREISVFKRQFKK